MTGEDNGSYSRRTVREFTSQPVNEEVLPQLIDAAIHSPVFAH
jgi:nitroreductase